MEENVEAYPRFPSPEFSLSQIALGVAVHCGDSPVDDAGVDIGDITRFQASRSLAPVNLPAICMGLSCVVRGAEHAAAYLRDHPEVLGVSAKLHHAMCLGRCYAGPVIEIAPGRYVQVE